jgi:Holliday junction resolvase RusA-like endonuclease
MNKQRVIIPFLLPSKKNSMEIRFNPTFWKLIKKIVNQFRVGGKVPYWIGPSERVKSFENNAALFIRSKIKKLPKRAAINILVYTKSIKQDTDNILGCIGDAVQKAVPGFNDNQFWDWHIKRRIDKNNPRIELIVKEFIDD